MSEFVEISKVKHRGNFCIACKTPFGSKAADLLRNIEGRKWSQTLKAWYLPYNNKSWKLLRNTFIQNNIEIKLVNEAQSDSKAVGKTVTQNPCNNENVDRFFDIPNTDLVYGIHLKINLASYESYLQMLKLKKYSEATQRTYSYFFKEFLNSFEYKNKEVAELQYIDIADYITLRTQKSGLTQRKQIISAIKFYYEKIVGREKLYFYSNKRFDYKVNPIMFDWQESYKIANQKIKNPTHRLVFYLVFYLGFKSKDLSELLLNPINELRKHPLFNYDVVQNELKSLIKEHVYSFNNFKYLFETKGRGFEPSEMRRYIWNVCSVNQIHEVFIKEFDNILIQSPLEQSTVRQYRSAFKIFITSLKYQNPVTISTKKIKDFLYWYSSDKAAETQNAMINAVKFYYRYCRNRELLNRDIPRAKRGNHKPKVLSPEQVFSIIKSYDNIKHQTLIALIYSAGLRRSEARKMKVNDINFSRNNIFIRSAKGNKDRYTILSKTIKVLLKKYIEEYNPTDYLFYGGSTRSMYSYSSMAKVLEKGVKRAGIEQEVTLHTLRHSFATHLLEAGHDIRYLQVILGHESIKTTQRYTHVAKENFLQIESPLDNINLKNNSPP